MPKSPGSDVGCMSTPAARWSSQLNNGAFTRCLSILIQCSFLAKVKPKVSKRQLQKGSIEKRQGLDDVICVKSMLYGSKLPHVNAIWGVALIAVQCSFRFAS